MKRIVADTGPLLHLHEAGALHLLESIGSVHVPSLVLAELRHHAPILWPGILPEWVTHIELESSARKSALAWQQAGLLHGGEAEALALAGDMQLDWFLTDDAAARLMAETIGIETHGSLGVVLWAAATSLIGRAEAETYLTGLENSSLWMSPRVRAEARLALERLARGS